MESDGLWKHTGRTDKTGPEKAAIFVLNMICTQVNQQKRVSDYESD